MKKLNVKEVVFLILFIPDQTYVAGTSLTIADLSILSSITQLEAMEYKLTGYRFLRYLNKS